MSLKKLKGENTKRKIIDVATILFSENGYDKTSVENICEKAEISKGAFFHHFPTKEHLFLEILNEFLEKLDERMKEIEKKSKNIPLAMLEMTKILEEIFILSEGKFTIFIEFLKKSQKNENIMNRISTHFKKYENFVFDLIEKGKIEKSIKESIDSSFYSFLIISLSIGMIIRKALFKENDLDLSKEIFDFILNSIKKEEEI